MIATAFPAASRFPAGGVNFQYPLYNSVMAVLTRVDMGTLGRVGTALADPTRRRVLVHRLEVASLGWAS